MTVTSFEHSVVVDATADDLYDLLSDITRTGEWSPVCVSCWWDDASEAGRVGAWFTGRNVLPERTWETRSEVQTADRGREFSWVVGAGFVRWGFSFAPVGDATRVTESWTFLPAGLAMFRERYGDDADAQIADRAAQALEGIPKTLAAITRIAETGAETGAEIGTAHPGRTA